MTITTTALDLAGRLAVSAAAREGTDASQRDVAGWLAQRRRAHSFRVNRIPFADLDGWFFHPDNGNLVHRSGKFFSVEGMTGRTTTGRVAQWSQPIIKQPEVGILGILAKEIDGVLHFLMQAKMEPGNPNLLQLSPTVQATRSNYTGVHGGARVAYLDLFADRRGHVIADVLQSEHGSWFYRKRNRNMVIEVTGDVPVADDFCWLTLGQLNVLLGHDNVVNMDSRTVLSCLPSPSGASVAGDFAAALAVSRRADAPTLRRTEEILSWFTDQRVRHDLDVSLIPLRDVEGWHQGPYEISRPDGRFFRVVAVDVGADSREIGQWTQPLFEARGTGVAAFVVRQFDGVLHVLVHARLEGGLFDQVELAPTVQIVPQGYGRDEWPFLLDHVLSAGPERIRYAAVHSEEGGRFLNTESRYLIVEADGSVPAEPPADFAWVTLRQLTELLRHSNYLNVQARTLVTCLNSIA